MAIPSDSRFKNTPLININGKEAYGRWVAPDFLSDPKLQISKYLVTSGLAGRPDLISNSVYGTPEYYWVIVAYNKPIDTLNWPDVGDLIDIPDIKAIISEL